ncbi:MAG: MerR family transcriptional regulator [Pseudoclavibacter sp.]
MPASMTIGDFSRATRLSAKALRFYHRVGLLEPAAVDPSNSYRLYDAGQIDDARMIHQLRALDMPLDDVRRALAARDPEVLRTTISEHLDRMEQRLAATRASIASLRALLEAQPRNPIEVREAPQQDVLIIRDTIELRDLGEWFETTRRELDEAAASAGLETAAPLGGLWSTELFLDEAGDAALFFPVDASARSATSATSARLGRASIETLPAARLAVIVHEGDDATIGDSYAALGAHVATLGVSTPGALRETYRGGAPSGAGTTEIGWPIG